MGNIKEQGHWFNGIKKVFARRDNLQRNTLLTNKETLSPELSLTVRQVHTSVPILEQQFKKQGWDIEYGNVLAFAMHAYSENLPLSDNEYIEKRFNGQLDVDWEFTNRLAIEVAKKHKLAIPDYSSMSLSELFTPYQDEQEKIDDFKSITNERVLTNTEYIDVYRGIQEHPGIQYAGAFRDLRFKFPLVTELPPSIVAYINGESISLVRGGRKEEYQKPLLICAANNLGRSGMDESWLLSTTSDPKFASKVGRYVIHARVPKTMTVDCKQIFSNQDKNKTEDRENEVGLIGWMDPAWIVSVTEGSKKVSDPYFDYLKNIEPTVMQEFINLSELRESLADRGFDPHNFLEMLSKHPKLKQLYNSDAHVDEGYSIRQHTEMVMMQYEKYFKDKPLPIVDDKPITPAFMRMVLALHDLGKPIAEHYGESKNNQHYYGRQFTYSFMLWSGFSKTESTLAKTLVNQDWMGHYIHNTLNKDKKDCFNMARHIGKYSIRDIRLPSSISTKVVYDLSKIYYMVDAGAYTENAGGKYALDKIFSFDSENKNMGFSPEVASRVEILDRYISTYTNYYRRFADGE